MNARVLMSSLDLRPIPLEPAAAMLQRVGERLLSALLHQQPPPSLVQLVPSRELPLLLPYAWGRQAVPLRRFLFMAWLRQGIWWLFPLTRNAWTPPKLSKPLERSLRRVVKHPISDADWRGFATIWVDRHIGGIDSRWLSDPFWPLAGERAWADEHFVGRTSRLLRQTLARQVLFFPGLPPVPILAPQCYWALIALAEIGNPQLLLPWPRRRLVRAALQRLQSIAAGIALSAGWAGFWDQWVLSEAQRQWSKPKSNSASPLHQALAALPLHQSAGATVPQHEQPPFTLANPNWEQERPPWFDLLAQWNRKETPDHV